VSGILDKTGQILLDGDDVCFELADCPDGQQRTIRSLRQGSKFLMKNP
jgi:hypothetical protein